MAEPPKDKRGWTLPGYKYLGPGNSLNRGVPVNKLDKIAQKHDEKYEKISEDYKKHKIEKKEFEQSIRVADEEFIEEVSTFAPETKYDTIAKWLAYRGIESKHLLEKYTGIIYPKIKKER